MNWTEIGFAVAIVLAAISLVCAAIAFVLVLQGV